MKKILLSLGLALFCGAAMAQNSAIYKAQALEQKKDFAGAAAILDEALQNPKTTKFAQIYHTAAKYNAMVFNEELGKAASGIPFDTTKFVNLLDKIVDYYTKSHEADITPDKKGRVKSEFVQLNHIQMLYLLDYYNYAAIFMHQNKNTDGAITYFEKYLNLPKNPIFSQHETDSIYKSKKDAYSQTYFNLAQLYYKNKNWDKVISNIDEALKDTLNTRDLYMYKMQAYLEKGDSAQWLKTMQEGLANTGDENLAQNLLYYYYQKNDVAGAESMANEMITSSPDSKSAWYMKGCVELNLKKDYPAARECFGKALDIDPDFVNANANMASAYINQVITDKNNGKFKILGVKKSYSTKEKPIYDKELNYVQDLYKKALVHMEKVRGLVPDQPRTWAYSLQMIYENLDMKAEKAEIDGIIESIK